MTGNLDSTVGALAPSECALAGAARVKRWSALSFDRDRRPPPTWLERTQRLAGSGGLSGVLVFASVFMVWLQPDHEGVADGVIEGVRQAGPGKVACAPPCERQRNAKSDVHDNEFRQLEWERQTMRDGQVP